MLADTRPLVLGEFGMDSIREGEAHQAEFLSWQIERAFRAGLAGVVAFSFTDDWHRGGQQIEDWAFGLTTRDRQPKPAYAAVQRQFRVAPRYPLPRIPRVSVVVASYNGGRTLRTCLESLRHLNYPDYEVILVDDGSTDDLAAAMEAYRGQVTVIRGDSIRTGVTAILPTQNVFFDRVIAGHFVLNGAGELTSSMVITEWGRIETPVYLTSTHAVGRVYDGAIDVAIAADPQVGAEDFVIPEIGRAHV